MKKNKKIMTEADYSELSLLKKNHKDYPQSPENAKIETFRNAFPDRDYVITFDCPEFTSLCPITSQPDFGHITVNYIAKNKCIESKALKLYLFSYRNHNTFHEVAVNTILDDLVAACKPKWMQVVGDFMPRGGIAIHVTAEYGKKD